MRESCLDCMGSPSPSSLRNPVLEHKNTHGRAAPTTVLCPQTGKEPAVSGVGVTRRDLWKPPPWHYVSFLPPTQQAGYHPGSQVIFSPHCTPFSPYCPGASVNCSRPHRLLSWAQDSYGQRFHQPTLVVWYKLGPG